MNIDDFLKKERENISKFIDPKYQSTELLQENRSPSKKYSLKTTIYVDKGTLPNGIQYWHRYMNGVVFKEDKKIFSINGTTCFYTEWIEKEKYPECAVNEFLRFLSAPPIPPARRARGAARVCG